MEHRCEAQTKAGERCKNRALLGSTRCHIASHKVSGKGKAKTTTVPKATSIATANKGPVSSAAEPRGRRSITPTPPRSTMPGPSTIKLTAARPMSQLPTLSKRKSAVEESTPVPVARTCNDQTWSASTSQPRIRFADEVSKTAEDDEVRLREYVHMNINATEENAQDIKTLRDSHKAQACRITEMTETCEELMKRLDMMEEEQEEIKELKGKRQ
jgi:hypothetical protein